VRLDEAFLITFFAGFVRCTAMLLSSPLAGGVVPVMVRIFLGVVVALSLTPVVQPFVPVPTTMMDLIGLVVREAAAGLVIGMMLQFLVSAFQMAGSIMDLQVGIASAQILNPSTGGMSTPIGQFKFWLSLVLLFLLNAHQMMFKALVASYQLPGVIGGNTGQIIEACLATFGQLMMICIQIAAPVVGVTVVIDVAAGLINKAVPQTQPFLLSLPAKLALGIVTLSLGLPGIVIIVERAVNISFDGIGRVLGG
jgi:flagellar biosynthetic protein FliR